MKIKVLYITSNARLYGANKSLLNLISGLSDHIKPMVIVPKKGDLVQVLDEMKVPYTILKMPVIAYPKKESSILGAIKFFNKKRKLTSKRRIAVKQINTIVENDDVDIIHTNTSILDVGYVSAKEKGKMHIWHLREFQKKDYNLDLLININEYQQMINDSDRVICISKAIKKHFNPIGNSSVIYNGVLPSSDFSITEEKANYFIWCGTIIPSKGVEDAIKAMALVKNKSNRLKIIGEGSKAYITYINQLIEELGLSNRIEFLGYQKNVLDYYKSATGLLMCSRNEGMGRVTVEAMSQGCAVIGYNAPATNEIIIHGQNGLLYRTVEELAGFMDSLLNDRILRKRVTENAYNQAKEQFSQESYSRKVLDVYRDLVSDSFK